MNTNLHVNFPALNALSFRKTVKEIVPVLLRFGTINTFATSALR